MERERYSRREFLGLSGACGFAALRLIARPSHPDQAQLAPQSSPVHLEKNSRSSAEIDTSNRGIRIIDAAGIDCEGSPVDVLANPDLMRANILSRARQMISPEYVPEVEKKVNNLVISFGSRDHASVLASALNKSRSTEEGSLQTLVMQVVLTLMNVGIEPNGFYLRGEHPLMYFNTSQILKSKKTTLREVWDHEVAHLIYMTDPATRDSIMSHAMKYAAVHASLLLTISASATAINSKLFANMKGMSMESYVHEKKKIILKRFWRLCEIMNLPTVFLTHGIHYQYFDKDEQLARESEERFPTPDDEFNEMIQVVPRQEPHLDVSRPRG